jgi:AmmeMemoRadiSam system protein A
MFNPESIYTRLAFETICHFVRNQSDQLITGGLVSEELIHKQACFVSIHTADGLLRGCIGTIEPVTDSLFNEIRRNAIAACSRDTRFSPVIKNELSDIHVSVDLLSTPEKIDDLGQLDPALYGVIVSDGSFRRGVLLPSLEGVDTVDEQLAIVIRKAGLTGISPLELEISRFTSTRFH